jgi:hypothetical protein
MQRGDLAPAHSGHGKQHRRGDDAAQDQKLVHGIVTAEPLDRRIQCGGQRDAAAHAHDRQQRVVLALAWRGASSRCSRSIWISRM